MQRKVLIVEDEMILNLYLSSFLRKRGYDVEMVNSGEKCLALLDGGYRPDVILMDINLGAGRLDGPTVTRHVNAHYNIPVVLHTAYTDELTLNSTLEMRKYGYIQKVPGNEQIVAASIEMALRLHQYERQIEQNERFLNDVFNSIQDGICVIDREFNVVQINEKLKEWFIPEIDVDNIKTRECYKLFQNQVSKCKTCPTHRAFETGETERDVFYDVHGLSPKWIEVYSYPLRSANGEDIDGVVEHIRDITEIKNTEQKIKESYARSSWLNEIGRNALAHWSISDIIEYTVKLISSRFPKYRTVFGSLDEDNVCRMAKSYHSGADALEDPFTIDFSPASGYVQTLRNQGNMVINDIDEDESVRQIAEELDRLNIRSLISALIKQDEAPDYLICFTAPAAHRWSDHEVLTVREITDYLTLAVKNIHYQQLLAAGEQQYKNLSTHLQSVWEEQNEYIAREIHDDLGQAMTALKMNLYMIEQALSGEEGCSSSSIGDTVEYMRNVIDDTVLKVRELSRRLRPIVLDTSGIIEALEWLVLEQEKYSEQHVEFKTSIDKIDLDKRKALTVFRIVQEALNNSIRHSRADTVIVEVGIDKRLLTVSIQDNGIGFDVDSVDTRKSFGLFGMCERAAHAQGDVHIRSVIGEGTEIVLTVPLDG